jgi:hypothetical protein
MSIAALSTELDEHIVGYLSHADRHSLSLTSKYYRHLKFNPKDGCGVPLLFLTMLERKELALYVKSFTLEDAQTRTHTEDTHDQTSTSSLSTTDGSRNFRSVKDAHICTRLLSHTVSIQGAIQSITASLQDPHFTSKWFGAIFNSTTNFEAAVAFILSLAMNLEHLQFMNFTPTATYYWDAGFGTNLKVLSLVKTMCARALSVVGP